MVDDVCVEKPIAYAYIDDRAICFNGKTEGLANRVLNFENWLNKDEDAVNEYLTNLSAQICDVFENLLESEDITIPDDQREGAEEEARLFGSDQLCIGYGLDPYNNLQDQAANNDWHIYIGNVGAQGSTDNTSSSGEGTSTTGKLRLVE